MPDGVSLHYRDYPGPEDRLPLLCLHGLTRNSADFAELAEYLSPARRVIALDFRGRGRSEYDPRPERYTPLTYAADVLALLDHLGVERAIFLGTSLGGLVTMTVAALAPDRIAAAILNDVGPELGEAGLERIKTYVGKDVRFGSWEEAAAAIADGNRDTARRYGPDDWMRMAKRLCREEGGTIRFDYDMAIGNVFSAKTATPTVDMWPFFKALAERPLLVLRGADSDLVSAEALERMAAAAPGARFVTVPDVGHPPDLGEPGSRAAIDSFLAAQAG